MLGLQDGIGGPITQVTYGPDVNGNLVFVPYGDVAGPGDQILLNESTGTDIFLYSYQPVERDFMGRLPDTTALDLHLGYRIKTGLRDGSVNLALDIFNIFDTQEAQIFDDVLELQQGHSNPNFLRPRTIGPVNAYQTPRQVRFGVTWVF